MNRPLRVALAGAGMVSRHHLIAWSRCADAAVVAIADPDRARAGARAAEFGVARCYGDAATMLDETRPDALDIAASHEAHAFLCALAAQRGVAILCQKPLAPTLPEAQAIVAATGDRVRLMVHENWRHRPYYRQAKAWLAAGEIGELRHLALRTRGGGLVAQADGTLPALVRQPMLARLERLAIGEVLVHHLDVACWLAGRLEVVAARTRHDVREVRGESGAMLDLEGDACTARVEGDLAVGGAGPALVDRMELVGSRGRIMLDQGTLWMVREGAADVALAFDLQTSYQASYDGAIAHFARALRHGERFETPPAVHLAVLALVEAAYRLAARAPD